MAVAIRDKAQAFGGASSLAVTIPVTVVAGDLLIFQASGVFVPSLPSGWTQVYANSGTNVGTLTAYKTAVAGDIGATLTVSFSGAQGNALSLIAVSGGTGVRLPGSHLWANTGGTGIPLSQIAASGDMVIYLGASRAGGGAPTLSRGSVDVSGSGGGTVLFGAVAGHELIASDQAVACTFTSPSGGTGYGFSTLVVSGGGTPPAVTFRDKAQSFSTASSTTITIPATVQAGDVLFLQAVGGWAPTVPSGWNTEYANSGSNIGSFVASRSATGADAGSVVTVAWSGAYDSVLNLIAFSPGSGVRGTQSHLWSSTGGTTTSGTQSVEPGDMVLYLGGNRQDGGAPTLSRGTTDASGVSGANVIGGVIGHEAILASNIHTVTYTSPVSGSGYEYSTMVVSGGAAATLYTMMSREATEVLVSDANTNAIVSRTSIEVLTNDLVINAQTSRTTIEVLIPTAPRYRGWGLRR